MAKKKETKVVKTNYQFKSFEINDDVLSKLIFSKDTHERLVGEYWLNHIRIERLKDYIAKQEANDNHSNTVKHLYKQLDAMVSYECCLLIKAKMLGVGLHNTYQEDYE